MFRLEQILCKLNENNQIGIERGGTSGSQKAVGTCHAKLPFLIVGVVHYVLGGFFRACEGGFAVAGASGIPWRNPVSAACGGALSTRGARNARVLRGSEGRKWVETGPFGFDETRARCGKMGGAGTNAVRRKCHERKEMRQICVQRPGGVVRRKSNPSKALTAMTAFSGVRIRVEGATRRAGRNVGGAN